MGLGIANVHVSQPLTEFAIAFMQEEQNFIADKIAPVVSVNKENDKYFKFDRSNWKDINDSKRAPGTESNKASVPRPSTDSYFIDEYSFHDIVPYREIDEADDPLQPKQDTTEFLMEKLMIGKEKRVADVLFVTAAVANYTSLAAANQWGYTSTTSPLGDVDTGIDAVEAAIGKVPNKGFIGRSVWTTLKRHAEIIDLIKYTQIGIADVGLVAAALGLEELNVGRALYDSTGEGITSTNVQYIWGKNMLISYLPANPGRKRLSHGYQFVHKNMPAQVTDWEKKDLGGYKVEATVAHDIKITCSLCGYTIFGAVA